MSMLDKIIESTFKRIESKQKLTPLSKVREIAESKHIKFDFLGALQKEKMNLICEVKQASPSKGIISQDFNPLLIAKEYERGGAAAISVLTEPDFFKGSDLYLEEISKNVNLPTLRKDFIINEYMIYEAKALGAAAILLIASVLDSAKLKSFYALAYELGLDVLCEVHNEFELELALKINPKIIGVNNRNLHDFSVDLNNTLRLKKLAPNDVVFVSESGLDSRNDLKILENNGIHAALIGETLIKAESKSKKIRELKGNDVKVKFCGLKREEDILYVNTLKPDFIGFVFTESKRQVSIKEAKHLSKMLDSSIKKVGVFKDTNEEFIFKALNEVKLDFLQLHGENNIHLFNSLKDKISSQIILAINIKDSLDSMDSLLAPFILLDSAQSGSGVCFDWRLLKNIKDFNKKFFLAGGINLENLDSALALNPYCIDVSSALETNRVKDFEKMQQFIKRIRNEE